MSLEIPQATVELAKRSAEQEQMLDIRMVTGVVLAAEQEGAPVDADLQDELAQGRQEQARTFYDYPVSGTGPTFESSLRIVWDILPYIRETQDSRHGRVLPPPMLSGAERIHRLREKGVVWVFDQRTGRSMWSAEYDELMAQRGAKAEVSPKPRALTDLLLGDRTILGQS